MMILNCLHLQFRAILGFENEVLIAAFMRGDMFIEPALMVLEEGKMSERPLAIGTPLGIHLQQTQVHPELDLVLPIFGFEPADHDLSGRIIPLVQQMCYVEVHARIWMAAGDKSTAPGAHGHSFQCSSAEQIPYPTMRGTMNLLRR